MFVPSWQHKVNGCSVFFWILISNERLHPDNINHMDIFVSYPQILVTNISNYKKICNLNLNISKNLQFDQQVCLLFTKAGEEGLSISSDDHTKFHYSASGGMGGKYMDSLIQHTMKKNPKRCFE